MMKPVRHGNGVPEAASGVGRRARQIWRPGAVVSLCERLSYGLGDFASGLYWQTFTLYLTFFYTDVFGLSALAAGTLLGMSRSLDALFDPVLGAVADRTQTRWGSFRPYLLWLSAPLALAGVLAFTVPDLAADDKRVWAWVTFNLLMLMFTGISIPYTALLAVLSPDPAERTTLASIKFVFAFAASMLVSAAVLPLCRVLGAGDAALGWQRCFMLIGALGTVTFLVTFFNTQERVLPKRQAANVLADLRDMFTNAPWLVLVGFTLLFNVTMAVRMSVIVHYFKYYVGSRSVALPAFLPDPGGTRSWSMEELVSAFNTSGALASLCGVVLMPALARAIGRKPAFVWLYAIVLASTAAVYWVRPEQVLLIFCLGLASSFAGGPLSPLLWAMYADTVDYAEWKTERRSTGLIFATVLLASKQGWAIGAVVSLGLLSNVGFVANAEQTPETLHGLLLLVSVVPAAIGAVALVLMLFYPLDDARLSRIGAELSARRAVESSAETA
jgi:GPH family glycoside/pentoside/hexuronide:cation symporter